MLFFYSYLVQNHPVRIRRSILPGQAKSCRILFAAEPVEDMGSLLKMLQNVPVLTVGESESFLSRGGMISLIKAKQGVRVEINLRAVEAANIRISSQLLKMARLR
jgi:hypothetical protein